MLRLSPKGSEPFWIDLLPGVRVQVRPISAAMMLVARAAAGDAFRSADRDSVHYANAAMTVSLAHQGIVAWEGIGDAEGAPLQVTPENIDLLLDEWPAFQALDDGYTRPALVAADEKNGSRPSPNGISAAGPNTAMPVTPTTSGAPDAPTVSTPRKRRTASSPGK
ncbi:hypothetical protein [Enterovirga sp. CN4-39]|uniref:hypothetical protein n=1 Tax=Enterovirga sp. CN4-39 TaxID=3400910 RepID=UPI003C0A89E8